MTRAEHLQWCKDRAFEILDNGGYPGEAYTSFVSDMRKHPETENHIALNMGVIMMLGGHCSTPDEMRKFIEGFN